MKLIVIDYGLCNLYSVYNALKYLGFKSVVSSNPEDLKDADSVILPGVGAFEDGMKGLRTKGFIEAISRYVNTGKPLLGICLGMELLMTKSYEFGEHAGLDLIKGEVVPFENQCVNGKWNFKIPHIGWNELHQADYGWHETPLADLKEGTEVYFVHSFYVKPSDRRNVLAETEYGGGKFCSVVSRENIFGCQFHPEKSSRDGLKILNNFVNLIRVKLT